MNIDIEKALKATKNAKEYDQGKSDGREERTIEIALRLKREDVASDIILRATGINIDAIKL